MIDPEKFTQSNHPALYYQEMLADHARMERYRQAITEAVKPGYVVADLGTGLGILAMMAIQAGASKAYAIDNRPRTIWMAAHVIRANGLEGQIELVQADVREVELTQKVDLIVNELIGDFGTDENIHESVAAFARKNLKEAGRILPSQLRTCLVPVEYGDEFHGVWREDYFGLNLAAAVDFPCREEAIMYGLRERPKELAPPAIVEEISFSADMPVREHRIQLDFEIEKAGTLQGFVGYFESILSGEIKLGNYPNYPTCHWDNWHWPVFPPVVVEPGQCIQATLDLRPNMIAAGWFMQWQRFDKP